jgi:hypothetical protein
MKELLDFELVSTVNRERSSDSGRVLDAGGGGRGHGRSRAERSVGDAGIQADDGNRRLKGQTATETSAGVTTATRRMLRGAGVFLQKQRLRRTGGKRTVEQVAQTKVQPGIQHNG